MKTFNVKLGYKIVYEAEVKVDADNVVDAMNKAIEACKNTSPDFKKAHATPPAIVSVNES